MELTVCKCHYSFAAFLKVNHRPSAKFCSLGSIYIYFREYIFLCLMGGEG